MWTDYRWFSTEAEANAAIDAMKRVVERLIHCETVWRVRPTGMTGDNAFVAEYDIVLNECDVM